MALISCPECNAEISNQANACPKCAYPIKNSSAKVKVTEVQFTKKKLKIHRTIALTMFYLGLFSLPLMSILKGNGYGDSYFILLLSILWIILPISIIYLLILRILIWWNHA